MTYFALLETQHAAPYLALFMALLIKELFIPIPGAGTAAASIIGWKVASGDLLLFPTLLTVLIAISSGDAIHFAIARHPAVRQWCHERLFKPLIRFIPAWLRGTENSPPVVQRWLREHQFFVLVGGRLIPGWHTPIVLGCGLIGMGWRRFLLFNGVGILLWDCLYLAVGALAFMGDTSLLTVLPAPVAVALSGLIVLAVVLVSRQVLRALRRRMERSASQ